jgi:4-hydroxy-4-methyl-2-oxoglutarate aldolase
VLEDIDDPPGQGAFVGDVHTAILKALGCIGYLTNGAVRELPAVRNMGFQLFAGSLTVSRAYAHIFELGASVRMGGMDVRPGDLLHGDLHGVINVPLAIATEVPAIAAKLRMEESKVIEFCRSNEFSVTKLNDAMKSLE